MRGGDCERDGEVDRGFGDFDAARDVDEDIFGGEAELGALFQYGDDHADAVATRAAHLAPRGADDAACGQRLDLDQQHAGTLHRGGDDGAAGLTLGTIVFHEQVAGVGDFLETFAGHLEQSHLVCRAEAVLHAADDAVAVVAVALEVDDGVDDVLDDFRSGERARLGDVADEDDGDAGEFREVDQVHAALAQLRDAAGGG